nr:hypothetical protein CFP56_46659 [Quercus suber]
MQHAFVVGHIFVFAEQSNRLEHVCFRGVGWGVREVIGVARSRAWEGCGSATDFTVSSGGLYASDKSRSCLSWVQRALKAEAKRDPGDQAAHATSSHRGLDEPCKPKAEDVGEEKLGVDVCSITVAADYKHLCRKERGKDGAAAEVASVCMERVTTMRGCSHRRMNSSWNNAMDGAAVLA